MENGQYIQGSVWFYAPNKVAPPVFAFFFLLSGVWHFKQCWKHGSWPTTGLLPLATTLFLVGFILREVGACRYDNLEMYISSTVVLHMGPPIYQLCNYLILARLFIYIPYHAPIHPDRMVNDFWKLFCFIESFTGNAASQAADSSKVPYSVNVGKNMLKASLILQLVGMVFFVAVTARWHWNCSRDRMLDMADRVARRNIRNVLTTLYCSSLLIIARTIYRIVECFKSGPFNTQTAGTPFEPSSIAPILRYEWYFWVFEAVLMLCNTFLFNIRQPARDLPRGLRIYLAENGTEKHGADFQDCRKLWVRLIDPFDFGRIMRKDDRKWWEMPNDGASTTASKSGGSDIELLRA